MNLTPKQEAFCLAYLETGNASEAYRRAYDAANMKPEVISVKACELLKNGKVSVRIEELQSEVSERAIVSKEWVITKLVENIERAMQNTPVLDHEGSPTGEYRYEGSVANRALELVGKELRMFVDRKEVGQPGEFDNLSTHELRERIRREAEALGLNGRASEAPRGNGKAGGLVN